MLEIDVIQTRGFHNIEKDGEVTGFQFCVREKQYRGAWLSMIRTEDVIVDGEVFKKDDIIWHIDGFAFTPAQMLAIGNIQWPSNQVAALEIKKPGGLSQGYHEIQFAVRIIHCYLPPRVSSDAAFAANPPVHEQKKLLLV